jgi:hypothetical protein
MKRQKFSCPHCEEKLPDGFIISWGQRCRSLKRKRPPDGKEGASPAMEDAPESRSTTSEPTQPAGCRQIPVMTQEEAVAFATRVWQQMLKLPNGQRNLAEFIALGAIDPQAMAQGIFETGAAHALLTALYGPPENATNETKPSN